MITHKTKIVAVFGLVYLLVAGVALAFVTYKVIVSGSSLHERITAIAEKDARARAYSNLEKIMEESKSDREELVSHLLTEDEASSFLTELEALGAKAGVELTTDSLSVVKKEGLFNELSIQFAIKGNEESVKNMLLAFETLPYHSSISSLSYVRDDSGLTESTILIGVTLLKYDQ